MLSADYTMSHNNIDISQTQRYFLRS